MNHALRRRIRRHRKREPVVALRIEKVPRLLSQHRERKRLLVRELDLPQTAKLLKKLRAVQSIRVRASFREIRKLLDRKTEPEPQDQASLLKEFPVVLLRVGENAGAPRGGHRNRGRPLSSGGARDRDSKRDEKDDGGGSGLHRLRSMARHPGMVLFENPKPPRSVPKKNTSEARPSPSEPNLKCPMSELGDNCSASHEKVQPGLLRIRTA